MSNYATEVIVKNADGVFIQKFRSIKECAKHFSLKPNSILYRLSTGLPYDGYVFEKRETSSKLEFTYRYVPKGRTFKGDDVELDREKYKIISYELKDKHICITPCPYKMDRKVFVGSALCTACKAFKGRNKQSREVACNRKIDAC